jgi:hypothetical protein
VQEHARERALQVRQELPLRAQQGGEEPALRQGAEEGQPALAPVFYHGVDRILVSHRDSMAARSTMLVSSTHSLITSTFHLHRSLSHSLPNITRSPYGQRCKFLHDPRIANLYDHNVVAPDHCTKAKRNSNDIPVHLYHHRLASIRQVNPLIAPYTWDWCRPFCLTDGALARGPSMEFKDTYNLVCNSEPDAKILDWLAMTPAPAAPCAFDGGIFPRATLRELRRLCIALKIAALAATGNTLISRTSRRTVSFRPPFFPFFLFVLLKLSI